MPVVFRKERKTSLDVVACDGDGCREASNAASRSTARWMKPMTDDRSVNEFGEGDGASVPKESVGGIGGLGVSEGVHSLGFGRGHRWAADELDRWLSAGSD